jgi:hypothetical protein
VRAIDVLELSGYDEAPAVLQEKTKGPPEARRTQEAKAALARLAKQAAR